MQWTAVVPGKVIICGEHSVVYGRLALSSSIALKTAVTLSCAGNSTSKLENINLEIPALGSLFVTLTPSIYEKLFKLPLCYSLESLSNDINEISTSCSDVLSGLDASQITAVKIFLYLMGGILRRSTERIVALNEFSIFISGDLPLAKGLGSSASVAAGIATVFEAYVRQAETVDDDLRNIINKWTYNTEQFAHGKASGLDNFTVLNGGLIEARNGVFAKAALSSVVQNKFTLFLIDSGLPKSTIKTVTNVRQFYLSFPSLAAKIFDSIEGVSLELKKLLCEEACVKADAVRHLLNVNHCLLKALGVSNAVLDEIVTICERFNIGAKLTGGGGGGMVIALVDQESACEQLALLEKELSDRGFGVVKTHMTNTGLELSYNAGDDAISDS